MRTRMRVEILPTATCIIVTRMQYVNSQTKWHTFGILKLQ